MNGKPTPGEGSETHSVFGLMEPNEDSQNLKHMPRSTNRLSHASCVASFCRPSEMTRRSCSLPPDSGTEQTEDGRQPVWWMLLQGLLQRTSFPDYKQSFEDSKLFTFVLRWPCRLLVLRFMWLTEVRSRRVLRGVFFFVRWRRRTDFVTCPITSHS
jgi:hypothetical protein